MLLVSWNLAGRVKALDAQAERLRVLDPDIICLQELTPRTLPVWAERLRSAGYPTVAHPDPRSATGRSRPLFVMSACRQPARQLPLDGVPWPERVLTLRLHDGTELVNVHSPISPKPDLAKIRTHQAVHRHLAHAASGPRILCGDLNTPRKEHRDGRVWTFARDQHGRMRAERGEHWDKAELSLIRGLEPYGFRDAFRSLHGYGRAELSWQWPRFSGGYRLDHLILAGLEVNDCRYEHAWREQRLSDHSPLIARIAQPEQSDKLSTRMGELGTAPRERR